LVIASVVTGAADVDSVCVESIDVEFVDAEFMGGECFSVGAVPARSVPNIRFLI
jgi:hypothetical protein